MTNQTIHHTYSGRSTNWIGLALAAGLLVPLVSMARDSGPSWGSAGTTVALLVVVAVAAVHLLTASSVRATAGANGVTVHFGVFGWPRFRYSPSRIRHVEAIMIPAVQAAWGIYWTPRRGLMLTLRTGPALRLTLASGRTVTITTPDPDAAVAVLRSENPHLRPGHDA